MKPVQKTFFIYWTPVIFWAALIFLLSSRPGLRVATGVYDFLTRKPAHVIEYLTLSVLLFRALTYGGGSSGNKLSLKQVGLVSFLFTLLYAISDEVHQMFVPLREGRVSDLLFDAIGALLGIILAWRLFQNQKRKQEI